VTATVTEKESEDETKTIATVTVTVTVTATVTEIVTVTVTVTRIATEHAARDLVRVHLSEDALATHAPDLLLNVPTVDATTEHLPLTLLESVTGETPSMTTTKKLRKWCRTSSTVSQRNSKRSRKKMEKKSRRMRMRWR
jgi:hypothetical protein